MNATFKLLKDSADTNLYQKIKILNRKNPRGWPSVCAVLGLAGGVIVPILSAKFDVITWFVHSISVNSFLHVLSIVLCAQTLPLSLMGASCLELLKAKTKNKQLSPPASQLYLNSSTVTAIKPISQRRAGVLAVLLGITALPASSYAQQTVFNVPTTDVLDPGKVYFELDISAKPNDPKFSSFVPRGVVGVGGRVEVGLNVTGNIQPGADATTLVPAVKWKVYDGGDNGWAIAVGNNLFIPMRNKSYDLGTYSYTMVQKTFITKTRVGFGGYFFSKNVVAVEANRAGGQFTIEQPVTRKFGVQADWFTGKHANGYLTPGGYYKFTKKLTGYAAYSIGNANVKNGNHFLYFEVGYNFN